MVTGHRQAPLSAPLQVRGHNLISGLSPEVGGNDEGPNPHELIEASLVACTILTCQLYADRKQWNLVDTKVRVRIESENPEDGAVINSEIQFVGNLSTEQRQRLFEIANKCPIHRLLVGKIKINTHLLGGSAL